ncbi:hypothetical protein GGU11DRAFT_749355 [Lentinula aff. detonsa]|nr:hypothetical protein GGU11DRAFT_749355 [Lentinula aff. detonsa]
MSTTSNDSETIQQWRECILQAQAARQRAWEEEIARQEAEFAAEMERIEAEEKAAREAEEKAAREAEEKRRAEEQWIEEEKRREEEKKIAEERRIVEEQKKKQEELAEKKRKEDQRLAEAKRREEERVIAEAAAGAEDKQERTTAFAKLVAENKLEKEKAARELEKRQKPTAKSSRVDVEIPVSTSSPRRRTFKSKAIISEDSSDEVVEQPREVIPRGTKRKRTIKMIAKGSDNYDPEGEKSDRDVPPPPDLSQPRPPCSRCVMIGRPSECRPQSSRRQAQACAVCHQQRQRCSWSGDNAARRSRGKKVKLDDEVYEGPAARVGDRRIEGPGVAEQLATIAKHNEELVNIACRSLVLQQRMLHLMVRRERRELEAVEGEKDDEDEDEDGEGEEDEEEVKETKRKEEIREGKKRAE